MDYYKLINEQGFNGTTAMNLGTLLALLSLEKNKDYFIKENNSIVKAVNEYCEIHNIPDESKNDFLSEINEYSLK